MDRTFFFDNLQIKIMRSEHWATQYRDIDATLVTGAHAMLTYLTSDLCPPAHCIP